MIAPSERRRALAWGLLAAGVFVVAGVIANGNHYANIANQRQEAPTTTTRPRCRELAPDMEADPRGVALRKLARPGETLDYVAPEVRAYRDAATWRVIGYAETEDGTVYNLPGCG